MLRRCLFLLMLATIPTLAQSDKAGTASIAGRITREDRPLADVLVYANRANQYGGWLATGIAAKTDGDGRYRLTNVPAGNYLITPRTLADVVTGQDALSNGKPVLVQDGEAVENIDFSLRKGGVITGRVTDENGKPVVNEEIRLLKKAERGPNLSYYSPLFSLMNKTDDRGVYRLFGLPPDKYLVRVGSDEDGTPLRNRYDSAYHPPTFYPDVTKEAEAKVVEVTEGSEHTDIDIRLAQAEPLYTVKGRIVEATTGQPIVGVRVLATRFSNSGPRLGSIGLERTNLRGEFQIPGFGPGSYSVILAMEEGVNHYTAEQKFEIVNRDVTGLELKATPGSTISGRVVVEGTKDPALLNVRAFALSVVTEPPERVQQSARLTLNPDGSFRAVGLSPGKVRFYVNSRGMMFGTPRPVILRLEKDGQTWPDAFPLNANENAYNVRIVVAYALGVVRGQVNIIGAPPADVGQVRVFLNPRAPGNTRENRSAPVDANGRFWLEGVMPGEYQIVANTYRPAAAGKTRKPPVPQSITVTSDKEAQITLTLDMTEEERK